MSAAEFSPEVVRQMWARSYAACERCGRGLSRWTRGRLWSAHHRKPRGAGGASTNAELGLASNGLILCGHGTSGCHGWVESNRAEAVAEGFIVQGADAPETVPVNLYTFGVVKLTPNGGVVRA